MADTLDVASMIDTYFSAHVKSQKKVKKETKKSDDSAPKRTRRPRVKKEYKRVSAYITPEQYQKLDELATLNNQSLTDTMGEAIDAYYNVIKRRKKVSKK